MHQIDHNYIILLIIVVALVNYLWRFLGVYFSGYIKTDSIYARYVRLLAISITAAMVIKMVYTPQGILEKIPKLNIIATLLFAILAFYLSKKSIFISIIAAVLFFYSILAISNYQY